MIDQTLTMIPGPTPVHDRILLELARPTVSHVSPDFVESFRDCLAGLKRVVLTEQAQPFVVAGAGTLAMEMALVNLLGSDDRLLILSQGFFGDRWAQLAEAFGIPFDLVQAEWGQCVTPDELQGRLDGGAYRAVAMTHVDTSTGAAAPVAAYCELLAGRDELVLLDGVCATAGMEERFDDWGLDILLTGAQKAFGAPPGVAILFASPRAMARRRERTSVSAYYADLLRWEPIMNNPGLYFSTPAVNEVLAIGAAVGIILDEGLDARFRRHRRIAESMRAGLGSVGLEPFTAQEWLADTLSVPRYPDGVDDAAFRSAMGQRGVVVAGALGPIAGQALRVGHMGNIGSAEVFRTLQAVEDSLTSLGRPTRPGTAVAAAAPYWGA